MTRSIILLKHPVLSWWGQCSGKKGACGLWLIQLREIALKELKILKAVLQQISNRVSKDFFQQCIATLSHPSRFAAPSVNAKVGSGFFR